jgi:UDP-N-acetyl-D-glucosamine dehydrogenase
MRVSVVGQGYVGLTIAISAANSGHRVKGYDFNAKIVSQLNLGESHIEGIESSLVKSLVKNQAYRATSDPRELHGSEVIVIAVPTPLDVNRKPDLKYIEAAVSTIVENIHHKSLIINESTSFPGTLRNVIASEIESRSGILHLYAASPERVDPGNGIWGTKNTPRLVSGLSEEATNMAREFYSSFCDSIVVTSSPEVAEMAKLFENTFRQVNIALVNEFAQIAHALKIKPREVIDAAGTKPFGFMKFLPGAGVGGHCIPVDPSYLSFIAESVGVPATFIERANTVNLEMPRYVVDRIKNANSGELNGKSVVVIGVSYKADVADVRETPAELVIDLLREAGALVTWHDELVQSWRGEGSANIEGNEIAVVLMVHSSFDQNKLSDIPYIFDCTGKIANSDGI